jgi:pimeloyl-ACP methyl ester carboxylesterase
LLRQRTKAGAVAHGLRLISYDRPGYGDSTAAAGRVIADSAEDVRAICEALALEAVATWGISGGGPHALACAALLPDIVKVAAVFSSLAPRDAEGLDWLAGFSGDALEEVRLMLSDEAASRAQFEQACAELVGSTPDVLAQQWAGPDADADELAALTDDAVSMQLAVRPGIDGSWNDCFAQLQPWGFDLGQIAVPGRLMHGENDTAVPVSHGRWLAEHIPGVDATFYPGESHVLKAAHRDEADEWLAAYLRASSGS